MKIFLPLGKRVHFFNETLSKNYNYEASIVYLFVLFSCVTLLVENHTFSINNQIQLTANFCCYKMTTQLKCQLNLNKDSLVVHERLLKKYGCQLIKACNYR